MSTSAHLAGEYASSILGYPRMGTNRELKWALEKYFHVEFTQDELRAVATELQEGTWRELAAMGLTQVPGNTFSYYDHVLDSAFMVGAISQRFEALREQTDNDLDLYFSLCRGVPNFPPLELARFLGTMYHYRQPELEDNTAFALNADHIVEEYQRAKAIGIELRPVVIGPASLLLMSKKSPLAAEHFEPISLLDSLLPVYIELFAKLAKVGVTCVQLDEPWYTFDRSEAELAALGRAYATLASASQRPRILVTLPYGEAGPALPLLAATEVEAIGLDLIDGRVRPEDLAAIPGLRRKRLYAGVIDGKNIWKANKFVALDYLRELKAVIPDLVVSTSCTLLHVPYDLNAEYDLPAELNGHLAFAKQKVAEVVSLAKALVHGPTANWTAPGEIPDTANRAVRNRLAAVTESDRKRPPYRTRRASQRKRLGLPLVPTTTLGSFPQTPQIRNARHELGQGRMSYETYCEYLRAEIERLIRLQEDIGLDVLVHGEVERNDMIQYFAELLNGFAVTRNGWVQSYGTRAVRPPILYGDVSRRGAPMTVEWTGYAQSLTERPVKGILSGPVTMVARSFVRTDQPLRETAEQVALAVRDEIADLEEAGIAVIQVDEPSIRELLPRRGADQKEYVDWAVDTFRLATGGALASTQIHTHLNYSSLAVMVQAMERLDADVTALVATRSIDWVLDRLSDTDLTRGIAPGVYESRSARIPDIDEVDFHLTRAAAAIGIERLWVAPDGGLKTRYQWQLEPALRNMVTAARRLRRRHAAAASASDREEAALSAAARSRAGKSGAGKRAAARTAAAGASEGEGKGPAA